MDGLTYPLLDPVAFQIGPIVVRWYALAYLAGFIGGWRYCIWLANQTRGRPNGRDMDDFLTWAVIGTILGGRLGYVIFYNPGYFLQHPADIVKVWEGGMAFHGGLLGVIVAMALFARRRGFSPLSIGDLVACAAPIGLFFGRIANFINGELYGRATDSSWGVVFPHAGPQPRHPSQLYEALLEGLVLFLLLFVLARIAAVRMRPGLLAGLFLSGYGLARFLVEFVREPDPQLGFLWLGATMGQMLSLPMLLVGLGLMAYALSRGEPGPSRVRRGPAG